MHPNLKKYPNPALLLLATVVFIKSTQKELRVTFCEYAPTLHTVKAGLEEGKCI